MKPRAFTLLEVLIVVAIITLLAALLFPVFAHVRESGRRTTCASNLKQISLALTQYAQDYRTYPYIPSGCEPKMGSDWMDKILPYVKSERLFECPSDSNHLFRASCQPDDISDPNHPISFSGSYVFNLPYTSYIFDPTTKTATDTNIPPTSPLRYTRPSSTILVLDGNTVKSTHIAPGYTTPPPTDATTLPNYGVPDRHSGGVNVAFADGHVKWMSLDSLLKLSLWRINGPE